MLKNILEQNKEAFQETIQIKVLQHLNGIREGIAKTILTVDETNDNQVFSKDKNKLAAKRAAAGIKVDEETLDELSNKTLRSYAKKASAQMQQARKEFKSGKPFREIRPHIDTANKRREGLYAAGRAMVRNVTGTKGADFKKEETNYLDDLTIEEKQEILDYANELQLLDEILNKSSPASTYIDDFVHSKNSKFDGKSKKERIRMALGAYYGKQKEEVELEGSGVDEGKTYKDNQHSEHKGKGKDPIKIKRKETLAAKHMALNKEGINPFAIAWLKRNTEQEELDEATEWHEYKHETRKPGEFAHNAYISRRTKGKIFRTHTGGIGDPTVKSHKTREEAHGYLTKHGYKPTDNKFTEESKTDVEWINEETLNEDHSTHRHEYQNIHGHSAFVNIHRHKNHKSIMSHIPRIMSQFDKQDGRSVHDMDDVRGLKGEHDSIEDAEKELKKHGYHPVGHITIDRFKAPVIEKIKKK